MYLHRYRYNKLYLHRYRYNKLYLHRYHYNKLKNVSGKKKCLHLQGVCTLKNAAVSAWVALVLTAGVVRTETRVFVF